MNIPDTDRNMGIFDIFNKKKKPIPVIQQAGATLYPDKILIYTYNRVKEGFGIATNKVSIIPVTTDDDLLGSKIRHHLNLTLLNQPIPADYSANYKSFLKAAGFKTAKQEYDMAKNLSITKSGSELTISPSINGGASGKNKGFRPAHTSIRINSEIEDGVLGKRVRDAWDLCSIL